MAVNGQATQKKSKVAPASGGQKARCSALASCRNSLCDDSKNRWLEHNESSLLFVNNPDAIRPHARQQAN